MKRVSIRLDWLLKNVLAVTQERPHSCEVTLKSGKQIQLLNDVADEFLLMVYENQEFKVIDSKSDVQISNEDN